MFSGWPDFSTAEFDVVETFKSEPYSYQNVALNIICDTTFHVAFLFKYFDTILNRFEFLTLTDLTYNEQILRKFKWMKLAIKC